MKGYDNHSVSSPGHDVAGRGAPVFQRAVSRPAVSRFMGSLILMVCVGVFLNTVTLRSLFCQAEKGAIDSNRLEEKPISRAKDLYEENRLEEALEYARQAQKTAPEKADTWMVMGKIYLAQATPYKRNLGFEGLFRRELLGEAETAFRRAIELDPLNVEAMNHLSFILYAFRNIPGARDQLKKSLEIDPESSYACYLLAEIDLLQDRTEESVLGFRRSIQIDPDFIDAWSGLIRALVAENRLKEASESVNRLMNRDPELPECLAFAYIIFEDQDLLDDAVSLYQSLLNIAPERVDLRFQLGEASFRLGRKSLAEESFDSVLAVEPAHQGALYFKGCLLFGKGLLNEACVFFAQAARLEGGYQPDAINSLHFVALRFAEEYSFELAINILDTVLEHDPFNCTALSDKALALSKCGMSEDADAVYNQLLKLKPWESSYANNYALHFFGTGRAKQGLKMLDKAINIDGNTDATENAGSYYYYVLPDTEKAKTYFSLVLEADPERTKALVLNELLNRD